MAKSIDSGIAQGSGAIVEKVLGAVFPGIILDGVESFQNLKSGDLSAARALTGELSQYLLPRLADVQLNPFNRPTNEVAKLVTGAGISTVYGPGLNDSGVITKAGAYTGEADNFWLAKETPGTIGVWTSGQRGGYGVACIAAHPEDGQGYIALWDVAAANYGSGTTNNVGMREVVRRFGFDQLEHQIANDSHSQLQLGVRRDLNARNLTSGVRIKAMPASTYNKKGADCTAGYELKSA